MLYQEIPRSAPLAQGDILDGCPLFTLEAAGAAVDLAAPPTRWEARGIVLTQACDLAQAKTTKVLVGWVHAARNSSRVVS